MKTFTTASVKAALQQILNDTTEWTDAELIVNINRAIRQVFVDRPAARYSSPVAFTDEAAITSLSSGDVGLDIRWQDAVIHYAAAQCLLQNDRSTHNADLAKEQLQLYEGAL